MELVFGRHDEVAAWVSERTKCLISPPYVSIGATQDGQSFCAGVVFNGWNGFNIELTLASEAQLTRGAIRGIYHYVFQQSKATRATACTPRANKVMRRMLPRLGFEYEGLMRRYYGPNRSDDAFVFALFPENAGKF